MAYECLFELILSIMCEHSWHVGHLFSRRWILSKPIFAVIYRQEKSGEAKSASKEVNKKYGCFFRDYTRDHVFVKNLSASVGLNSLFSVIDCEKIFTVSSCNDHHAPKKIFAE